MTVVAVIFTPIVLLYQAWTYWVFRQRISVNLLPPKTALVDGAAGVTAPTK